MPTPGKAADAGGVITVFTVSGVVLLASASLIALRVNAPRHRATN
jgi:hypothetical protein